MTRERTLLENIETLREISRLEDGWNGPDSRAIEEYALAMVCTKKYNKVILRPMK